MQCHIAVPHGWKNKAFLVNLNDVGPEATCRQEDANEVPAGFKCTETIGLNNPMPPGTQVHIGTPMRNYTNPPYYRGALLKIQAFAPSGSWQPTNCGSVGPPGTGGNDTGWMDGGEGCVNTP